MGRDALTWELVPVAEVDRDELWDLYTKHFDAGRACLEQTLRLAQVVACFRDRTGKLRGMAAFCLREAVHDGQRVHWFWFGGAAMDEVCRGRWLLERAFLPTLLRFKLAHPLARVYCASVNISFQSFRMIARNFGTYWPHPERATPASDQAVLDAWRREMGSRWDPVRQVVHQSRRRCVRAASRRTTAPPNDPLRQYFEWVNPHADQGDGLVLIAPLDAANIAHLLGSALGRRVRDLAGRLGRLMPDQGLPDRAIAR